MIHINYPSSTRFVTRYKVRGGRKWHVLSHHLTFSVAASELGSKLSRHFDWKRGEVLLVADYYDPQVVLEVSKP